jgi:hypothetical protein
VKDDERRGQPKTKRSCEDVERMRPLRRSGRRLSVRITAEELNLNTGTVRRILTDDLGTRKISTKRSQEF